MPRASEFKGNYSAGALSPLLDARPDVAAFAGGVGDINGYIVLPEGALQNRPGTEFTAEVKDSSKDARLIPFVFSTIQTYMLEFGNQYIRFYRTKVQITGADIAVTGITQSNPAVLSVPSHGLSNGDQVVISDVSGMAEINNLRITVANVTTNTFEAAGINSNSYSPYVSGGVVNEPYEISSPYLEAELEDLQYVQSADTMYITHKLHKPQKLTRSGHTNWTLADYAPTGDTFTSTGNYPAAVAIYESRLWFGGSVNDPQKLWASVAQDFTDMTPGSNATDGLEYTIGAGQVNAILWLFSDQFLLVGTPGGVFVARGSGFDEAITPTNVQIKRQISNKCSTRAPVLVGSNVLFPSRLRQRLVSASLNGDSYESRNASLRNKEMIKGRIGQLAYQEEPHGIVWMKDDLGSLIGLTAEFDEQIAGWHPHTTAGQVRSVACIPGDDDDNGDQVWVIVKRTIGGQTRRYVERLVDREDDPDLPNEHYYVDCGLTYDDVPTMRVGGLHHLIGETVVVVADGSPEPSKVVDAAGGVDLDSEASVIHIGLEYTPTGKSLRAVSGSADGTAQGKKQMNRTVIMRFYRTVGAHVGPADDKLDEIIFRDADDIMGEPIPLFTGDKEKNIEGDWNTEGRVYFAQRSPLPQTLLGWTLKREVND